MNMFTWDDVRVVIASATGLGVQLANIDVIIKILVGIATICYITSKTIKLWQNKSEKD